MQIKVGPIHFSLICFNLVLIQVTLIKLDFIQSSSI